MTRNEAFTQAQQGFEEAQLALKRATEFNRQEPAFTSPLHSRRMTVAAAGYAFRGLLYSLLALTESE